MKIAYAYIIFLCLLFVILLFFTFFGKELYAIGKQTVITATATSYLGENDVFVPRQAVNCNDDGCYVFLVRSEQGYSRTIHTVYYTELEVFEFDDEYYKVINNPGGIRPGNMLVVDSTGELGDKDRVMLK